MSTLSIRSRLSAHHVPRPACALHARAGVGCCGGRVIRFRTEPLSVLDLVSSSHVRRRSEAGQSLAYYGSLVPPKKAERANERTSVRKSMSTNCWMGRCLDKLPEVLLHLVNARNLREGVAGRVLALGNANVFGDVERLDLTLVDESAETLAATRAEFAARAWVGHLYAERLGELTARVAHERDDALVIDALVFGPSIHDGSVVNAEDDNLVDPHLRKSHHLFLVAGDLARGSRGSERTREADKDHLLVSAPLGKVNVARVAEAEV
mmetsp:Transcript_70139/g.196312  ORF Transcript_70139/g.196312 Transcript_70139/m.196312 type:complete len:266 (-) Transcript_70139:470-1267(-)